LVTRPRALLALALAAAAPPTPFARVTPPVTLAFPRDHGAHPAFRTEWWYVTGWLDGPGGGRRGFQVTFFRTATGVGADNPSRFAPRQILFAHAALSDPAVGHLLHGERIARQGFGLAGAAIGDADVRIDDWQIRRLPDGRFVTHVAGEGFSPSARCSRSCRKAATATRRRGRAPTRRAATTACRTSRCRATYRRAAGPCPSAAPPGSTANGHPPT
jgi:hypothetical protein